MRPLKQLALWALLALPGSVALAQGCSMCKTSAEATAAEQQKAMNRGILVLALPPVIIFGGLSIFAMRYRSKRPDAEPRREKGEDAGLL